MQSIHVRMHFPLQIKLHFLDTKLIIFESLFTGVKVMFFSALHLYSYCLQFSQESGRGSISDHGGSDHLENRY